MLGNKRGANLHPKNRNLHCPTAGAANQIDMLNETDLHYKVVDCVRTKYAELIVVPRLGGDANECEAEERRLEEGLRRRAARHSDLKPNFKALSLKHRKGTEN